MMRVGPTYFDTIEASMWAAHHDVMLRLADPQVTLSAVRSVSAVLDDLVEVELHESYDLRCHDTREHLMQFARFELPGTDTYIGDAVPIHLNVGLGRMLVLQVRACLRQGAMEPVDPEGVVFRGLGPERENWMVALMMEGGEKLGVFDLIDEELDDWLLNEVELPMQDWGLLRLDPDIELDEVDDTGRRVHQALEAALARVLLGYP